MNTINKKTSVRWAYMAVGVIAMLFAGVLYAWSILKSPLAAEFGWGPSELALNFTLAMTFFCIGGLFGAQLSRRLGHRIALIIAGALAAVGFALTSTLHGAFVGALYVTYGLLAGTGIGIAYNVVIATVSAWFPDKKGLCSGCLMMGFGASALVLGNAADAMFKSAMGWRGTYVALGLAILAVLALAGIILKKPDFAVAAKASSGTDDGGEALKKQEFTSKQMLCRPSFWMAFMCISFLAAVGSSVISFAKDLALAVNAPEALAVSLVGVPIGIFILLKGWDKDRSRATMSMLFIVCGWATFFSQWAAGLYTADLFKLAVSGTVASLIGQELGFRAGRYLNQKMFTRFVLFFLSIAAVTLFYKSIQ